LVVWIKPWGGTPTAISKAASPRVDRNTGKNSGTVQRCPVADAFTEGQDGEDLDGKAAGWIARGVYLSAGSAEPRGLKICLTGSLEARRLLMGA